MNTTANRTFTVPTREEVSSNNQQIFDSLHKMIGFVPNLYAYYAKMKPLWPIIWLYKIAKVL